MTLGGTAIKTWSTIQPTINLSSGEAGLSAFVKSVAEKIGVTSLSRDLGVDFTHVVAVDRSAAVGMENRSGVGRVRHLEVQNFWVQERV